MNHSVTDRAGLRPTPLAAAWFAAFIAAIVAYWPGLSGPFMLDDFTTIAQLGNLGGVRDWETFKAFVFGGTAGPTGRPLALLTFLVDANNWPAESLPFKRTNLIIHLANAALLGLLARRLLALLGYEARTAGWLAFFTAATWMLHPFLVSTTLYAVQRMAQLAMLFSLAGLLSYLYGRSLLATNAPRAYLVMTSSLGLFTVLAALSKENGILLPMLVGVIELTIFASRRDVLPALDRRWSLLFITLPSLLIVSYLGYRFFSADFLEIARPRDFSLYERLLTQPRVVAEYLQHWFLPKLYTTGVFQDHIVKSTGLLSPLTTLIGFLFHGGLIALAIVKRRQLPLLAFAILFFYVNHLLESTTLNLEQYFEHRNYMAVAFLFLPLADALRDKLTGRIAVIIVVVLLLALGSFTRYSASVWSNYEGMVAASARKAPTSARAQAQYAIILFNAGQPDAALRVLDQAIERIDTNSPQLPVTRLIMLCNLNRLQPIEIDQAAAVLGPRLYDPRYLTFYSDLVQVLVENRCPAVSVERLEPLFAAMLDNPANTEPGSVALGHIRYLLGYVAVKAGDREGAASQFHASLEAQPDAGSAMTMAALMATSGFYVEALRLSDVALQHLDVVSRGVRLGLKVTEGDILEFQRIVRADLEAEAN